MAGITLAQAQARLQDYLDAEEAVLQRNQSYTLQSGQTLTRANLAAIQQGIDLWNQRVQALDASAAGRGRAINPNPAW